MTTVFLRRRAIVIDTGGSFVISDLRSTNGVEGPRPAHPQNRDLDRR